MIEKTDFCLANEGGSTLGSKSIEKQDELDKARHWDIIYTNSIEEKLGWFENDLSPAEKLIRLTGLDLNARILIAGAGNTRLVDYLLNQGFTSLIATDISRKSLSQLQARVGDKISVIVDDLTNPDKLLSIEPVDLWIDRAVLHFFIDEEERISYLSLLNRLVKPGGYVLLAEFAEDSAQKCSGLPLMRYSVDMLQDFLNNEYSLVEHFRYIYTMPSGDLRPYNYALFRRN